MSLTFATCLCRQLAARAPRAPSVLDQCLRVGSTPRAPTRPVGVRRSYPSWFAGRRFLPFPAWGRVFRPIADSNASVTGFRNAAPIFRPHHFAPPDAVRFHLGAPSFLGKVSDRRHRSQVTCSGVDVFRPRTTCLPQAIAPLSSWKCTGVPACCMSRLAVVVRAMDGRVRLDERLVKPQSEDSGLLASQSCRNSLRWWIGRKSHILRE